MRFLRLREKTGTGLYMYNLSLFSADIGGQAGFCIGASILSIMELGEWLLNIVIGVFRTLAGRRTVPDNEEQRKERTATSDM
jgi:hypothetical protein